MKFFGWIIAVPVAFVVIAFAIANRTPVGVNFDPLPYKLDIPLWAAVIAALAFGFFLGAVIRWLFDRRWLSETRRARRHIRAMEQEIAVLRQRLDHHTADPGERGKSEGRQNRLVPPPSRITSHRQAVSRSDLTSG